MKNIELVKRLGWLFMLPVAERDIFLRDAPHDVPLVFGEDGSATDNVLFFFSVCFANALHGYSLELQGERSSIARELAAVLVTMGNLPPSEDYIWIYRQNDRMTGTSGNLWLVIERYCKMLFQLEEWKSRSPDVSIVEMIDSIAYKHDPPIQVISDPRPRNED